jgi:SAM-dependent methyltransferase
MANHHHGHQHDHDDAADLAELLDLDAEVLHAYRCAVTDWVHGLAPDPTRRILDLGAGTGTGALALAERFAGAEVLAVDASAAMLARLAAKAATFGRPAAKADGHDRPAAEAGERGRIRTVEADLDAGWPAVGEVDLVWASNSMHHMADPDRVLGEVFGALTPGGLLAMAEMDSFPRFLTDEAGIELEARCHAAMTEERAADMPLLGSDWGPRLRKAGFIIEAQRQFVIDVAAPLPAAAGRFAQASLGRMRSGLDARLSAGDRAALDRMIDGHHPDGVLHRTDLRIRAERTVWAARHPIS